MDDENPGRHDLSPGWVTYLANAGFESTHWIDVGRPDAPDTELMRWASAQWICRVDRRSGFGAILAATQDGGPSVVQIRSDIPTPDAVGRAVIVARQQAQQELLEGALISVDATRARLRILPLK
jgi:predicted nuclease of predicted toxin-antitoxin system